MAQQNLILTVIGDDRPGLVERLSAAISAYGGNWEQASMSRLAGKFAGIVQISVAGDKAGALGQALDELEGLDITQTTAGQAPAAAGQRLTLSLVGHDRIGIVQEVSQVLAEQGVNVEQLNTYTASAPMVDKKPGHPFPQGAEGKERARSTALARQGIGFQQTVAQPQSQQQTENQGSQQGGKRGGGAAEAHGHPVLLWTGISRGRGLSPDGGSPFFLQQNGADGH